jgi:diacylglycerol O-acyltransferase / wax synthase
VVTPAVLGGIGVFHLMNDRGMRARGLPGNHCLLALELDGRVDIARLDVRLARAVSDMPELRFRLQKRVFGGPRWVVDGGRPAPRAELIQAGGDVVEARLAERVDGDTPWAIDVVRGEQDTVLFRWFHPLVDGKGAERLVKWLGSGSVDEPERPPPEEERFEASERPLKKLGREERGALMRAYGNYALELGRTPIMSLATIAKNEGRGGKMRFLRVALSEEETKRFDARVRKQARLAETSLMVIAAVRAVDRALVRRGYAPAQHIVPVPLSLDPKGEARRVLGNNLTMMMLSITRDDLADDARAIAHIAEQQRAIVRQKLDVGMLAALEFASMLPRPAYQWLADRPFHGEMASVVCSNPGTISISSFAGVPVRDAYVTPAPVLPPGFQVIFTRFAGRLSAVVAFVDTVVSRGEAGTLAEEIRGELCA